MESSALIASVKTRARKWLEPSFDEDTRHAVEKLLAAANTEQLVDAFYKDLEFGTGGLRGIMGPGTNRMNIYTIGMATQGLCNYLLRSFPKGKKLQVVVTHDSRNNSRLFAQTTADIFSANGIRVFLTDDFRPTPELSFAIRELKCQSGVVITASHNPPAYNGYKVYWEDGGQIIAPHDREIIREVKSIQSVSEVKFKGNPSLIQIVGSELDHTYLNRILQMSLNTEAIQQHHDIGIVYTPLHGTGVKLIPEVLKKMGFTKILHVPEQDIPDGNFPTVTSPNPEEPEALTLAIKKASENNAELVLASDPDADRAGMAILNKSGSYTLLNGNQTGSILVYYLLSNLHAQNKLKGNEYIVRTVVSSAIFDEIATHFGVKTYTVLTGFKFIAEQVRKLEGREVFIGGGEESFGFMIGDFVRDKDAVSTCAFLAETAAWAKSRGQTLLELLEEIYLRFGLFQERLISVVKEGLSGSEEIAAIMDRLRNQPPESLDGSDVVTVNDFLKQVSYDQLSQLRYDIKLPKSNVLQFVTKDGIIFSARPSGTEPKIKFYISVRKKIQVRSEIPEATQELQDRIDRIIREEIPV
ncbi:MAG: phospho-sugar mutase [Bacteroidales bacterium]|nr:phospho-sugar mutase [Bacteroidales bacterium]